MNRRSTHLLQARLKKSSKPRSICGQAALLISAAASKRATKQPCPRPPRRSVRSDCERASANLQAALRLIGTEQKDFWPGLSKQSVEVSKERRRRAARDRRASPNASRRPRSCP